MYERLHRMLHGAHFHGMSSDRRKGRTRTTGQIGEHGTTATAILRAKQSVDVVGR